MNEQTEKEQESRARIPRLEAEVATLRGRLELADIRVADALAEARTLRKIVGSILRGLSETE